jgi:hypothetical protein
VQELQQPAGQSGGLTPPGTIKSPEPTVCTTRAHGDFCPLTTQLNACGEMQ